MSLYSYGWEKFHVAVHSLAGALDQKKRLENAILFSLIHIVPERDIPPEILEEFILFMKEISSVSARGDEGTVHATVAGLDEIGVKLAVEKVIGFYDTICRYMPHN